ncbi:MAG: N-acetyl-gamma-glutamyl-phosphate reductase [Spirosomaceae bacterium]|nr:N-acetyl-gamma-glutamyl-phosphate reductase [Spirosomataceae bacterium]
MSQINIGIIGGAGYTGGELLRILLNHPNANIIFVNSKSQAGKPVYSTAENAIPASVKIIDLSTDFRDESNGFVYGLPELNRERIKTATKIANPGCFATSIELAILPLASQGLIYDDIHVSAITGSTGAGQALSATTHFSWRNNNISIYKAFTHQHLKEITQSVKSLQTDFGHLINFVPYRGNFTRGIMANVYTKFKGSIEEANELLISSIIDNLTKGASGQAVQNLNLIFGLEETAGLKLKPIGF